MSTKPHELFEAEQQRVRAEYRRREAAIEAGRYAPWQPAELLMRAGRKRVAATLLWRAGVFPQAGDRCLEIGYGRLGWLADLIDWGVRESDLSGIELDERRAEVARRALPAAELLVGDATELPWPDDTFRLVVASTVLTSVLDERVRRRIAHEAARVLAPGGALLWYDFAVNNPRNPHVRRVTRQELHSLFPALQGPVRRVTLAPPLARFLARRSWTGALLLEAVPWLRTHLLAVLVKPAAAGV